MENKSLYIQISKFVMVGISNSIISYLVFIVSFNNILIGNVFASQSFSYSAGILWSFYWNAKWTFTSKRKKSSLLISFVLLQITLLFLSSFMIETFKRNLGWNISLIWFLVMFAITVTNFLSSKILIFKT